MRIVARLNVVVLRPIAVVLAAAGLLAFSQSASAADFSQPLTSPETAGGLGSGPQSVAVEDFNRDGHDDQAVANSQSGNLTILLGDGTGNFTVLGTEATGTFPRAVVAGDFDGNGRIDLATANSGSNNVTILLGDGTGNFNSASSPTTGTGPVALAVGDFNGNGADDLAVTNQDSNNVTVLLGAGNGTFSAAPGSPKAVGLGPTSVAVGDFDDNGKDDLAVGNASSGNVSILLGVGTGDFNAPAGGTSPEAVGSIPRTVSVGDFDRNGRDDIAVAKANGDVTILRGFGGGDFIALTTVENVGSDPHAIVGDFNDDGKDDIATANTGSNNVTILIGNGLEAFTPAATSPESVGAFPIALGIGDFDRDGKDDLSVANFDDGTVSILLNQSLPDSTSNFRQAPTSPEAAGNFPVSIAVGDFNGDAQPDQAVANFLSNDVAILIGNGGGNFLPAGAEAAGGGPSAVAVGRFNGDGFDDLAVANYEDGTVSILLGDGQGDFTPAGTETVGTHPVAIGVGDFDGNGRDDLAVVNGGPETVTILMGQGAGDFTAAGTEGVGDFPSAVTVGDFDRDGADDLVVTNTDSNNLTILIGEGNGDFNAAGGPVSVGNDPTATAAGDFDNDGDEDLAVSKQADGNVTILQNDGSAAFTASTPVVTGSGARALVVGDFNRDGDEDLALADSGDDDVKILIGGAGNSFTVAPNRPQVAGFAPASIVAADFDRDGRDDLALAYEELDNVTILLGDAQRLDVSTAGTGSGFVSSSPPGIDCGRNVSGRTDCQEFYADGESVTLTANPAASTDFSGFTGGGCAGTGTSCTVSLDQARSVTATFTLKQRRLSVSTSALGEDGGFVTGTGIDCGGPTRTDCIEEAPDGTQITLTATPAAGFDFAGFTGGGCSTSPCTVTLDADKPVEAAFTRTQRTLTVTTSGTGSGTVTGLGINCGAGGNDCTETVPDGIRIALTATPAAGSDFAGFSGDCTFDPCQVTMDAARSVDAAFSLAPAPPPDTTAPETTITKKPSKKAKKPAFSFESSESGSTFTCAVDGAKPKSCTSPTTLKKLKPGKHSFEVFATDRAGNADRTPAKAKFKLKKKKK